MARTTWQNLKRKEQQGTTEEYTVAVAGRLDVWVPAFGGHAQPCGGFLYVFNPAAAYKGEPTHGWLNLSTDIVQFTSPYTNQEAK